MCMGQGSPLAPVRQLAHALVNLDAAEALQQVAQRALPEAQHLQRGATQVFFASGGQGVPPDGQPACTAALAPGLLPAAHPGTHSHLASLLRVKHVDQEEAKVALQPDHVAAAAVHHLQQGRAVQLPAPALYK